MQIIIFGAPGAGKGTQAKIIAKKLNIPHISTGDILRRAIEKKTAMGTRVKALIDAGELVPDDEMKEIIKARLLEPDCQNGYMLDGFPRTTHQAIVLDEILNDNGNPEITLLKLNIEDQIIINRLTSRRNCSNCGSIVNLLQLKDKHSCPNCGKKDSFIQRDDDTETVIKNRLHVYERQTAPVLEYYKDKREIILIDSVGSVDEISANIMDKLT